MELIIILQQQKPGSGSECLSSAQKYYPPRFLYLYLSFQKRQHVSQRAVCTYLQMHCRRRTRGCFRLWYLRPNLLKFIKAADGPSHKTQFCLCKCHFLIIFDSGRNRHLVKTHDRCQYELRNDIVEMKSAMLN